MVMEENMRKELEVELETPADFTSPEILYEKLVALSLIHI